VIVSGGELTLAMLDLSFDAIAKFYEAPLQLKANGGSSSSTTSGGRWSAPSICSTGGLFPREGARLSDAAEREEVRNPFDQIILFSTNIAPRELADEAFLRRIGYKIKIDYLGRRSTSGSAARCASASAFRSGRRLSASCWTRSTPGAGCG